MLRLFFIHTGKHGIGLWSYLVPVAIFQLQFNTEHEIVNRERCLVVNIPEAVKVIAAQLIKKYI